MKHFFFLLKTSPIARLKQVAFIIPSYPALVMILTQIYRRTIAERACNTAPKTIAVEKPTCLRAFPYTRVNARYLDIQAPAAKKIPNEKKRALSLVAEEVLRACRCRS